MTASRGAKTIWLGLREVAVVVEGARYAPGSWPKEGVVYKGMDLSTLLY